MNGFFENTLVPLTVYSSYNDIEAQNGFWSVMSDMTAKYTGGMFRISGSKFMDYKNDNRTPRDRITGEFLSELLFTELGGDCDCRYAPRSSGECSCERNDNIDRTIRSERYESNRRTVRTSVGAASGARMKNNINNSANNCNVYGYKKESSGGGNVEISGNYSLAMAYIPIQEFGELFDIEDGFCEGTIFKALRFPFYPTPCRKEND